MKNYFTIPIIILSLIIAFALVNLLFFIVPGNEKLIRARLKIITLLMTFNIFTGVLKAQERVEPLRFLYGPPPAKLMLGADVSMNYSSGMNLALTHLKNEWIADYNVHGISAGFGGFFQYIAPSYSSMEHSLIIGIGYNSCRMSVEEPVFYTVNYIEPFLDENLKKNKADAEIEHEFSTLTLKALYNFRFWGGLSFSCGPSITLVLDNTLIERVSFDEKLAGKVKFKENLNPQRLESPSSAILFKGEPAKSRTFLVGGTIDLRYYFDIDYKFSIIPYIGIDYFVTDITEGSGWKVMYTNFGIAVSYRIE